MNVTLRDAEALLISALPADLHPARASIILGIAFDRILALDPFRIATLAGADRLSDPRVALQILAQLANFGLVIVQAPGEETPRLHVELLSLTRANNRWHRIFAHAYLT